MSIQNINLLQNQEDLRFNDNIHNADYYVQALANLGQRIGVTADRIDYKKFTFLDIFDIKKGIYDPDKYIGVIKHITNDNIDKISLEIHDINSVDIDAISQVSISNINDTCWLTNDTGFDIVINNIQRYLKERSFVCTKGGYFISNLVGKILGTLDTDADNIEWQWTKINLETHTLDSAIRAWHIVDDVYALLIIRYKETVNSKDIYDCTVTTTHVNSININETNAANDSHINQIKNTFSFSNINEGMLNADLSKHTTLDEVLTDEHPGNIYNILYDNRIYDNIDNFTVELERDTVRDAEITVSQDSIGSRQYANIEELLSNDILNLYNRITAINNDVSLTFPNMLNLWTSEQFNKNKVSLVKRIFVQLFEYLCANYGNSNKTNVMYVPLDYKFNYVTSLSETLRLYYINDIYVTMSDLNQFEGNTQGMTLQDFFNINRNIIFDYEEDDKIKLFGIIMNYDNIYRDYINSLEIEERYTLPFVNAKNNWQINDIDTTIRAVGKNAGQPNIILLMTSGDENNLKFTVLHAADADMIQNCSPETLYFNTDDGTTETVSMPKLSENNMDLFNNALIINIKQNTEYTSLWHIDMLNGKPVFEYLKTEDLDDAGNEYALTLSDVFNFEKIIPKIINENHLANGNIFNDVIFDEKDTNFRQNGDDSKVYFVMSQVSEPSETHNEQAQTEKELEIYTSDIEKIGSFGTTKSNPHPLFLDQYLKHVKNNTNNDMVIKKYPLWVSKQTTFIVDKNTNSETSEGAQENQYENTGDFILTSSLYKRYDTITENNDTFNITYTQYTLDEQGYENEYVPGYVTVPTVNFAETLLSNVNVLNRTNILSIAENGYVYNAYIGCNWTDKDKSMLHFGTYNTNINIGGNTLISPAYRTTFEEHLGLDIDFNKINLNGITQTEISYSNSNFIVDNQTVQIWDAHTSNIGEVTEIRSSVAAPALKIENNRLVVSEIGAKLNDNNYDYINYDYLKIPCSDPSISYIFLNVNKLMDKYGCPKIGALSEDIVSIKYSTSNEQIEFPSSSGWSNPINNIIENYIENDGLYYFINLGTLNTFDELDIDGLNIIKHIGFNLTWYWNGTKLHILISNKKNLDKNIPVVYGTSSSISFVPQTNYTPGQGPSADYYIMTADETENYNAAIERLESTHSLDINP